MYKLYIQLNCVIINFSCFDRYKMIIILDKVWELQKEFKKIFRKGYQYGMDTYDEGWMIAEENVVLEACGQGKAYTPQKKLDRECG